MVEQTGLGRNVRKREMTDMEIRKLKPPGFAANGKAVTKLVFVGGVRGLALQLTGTDGRSWIARVVIAGKRRTLGLGSYPTIGLGDARRIAREYREEGCSAVTACFGCRIGHTDVLYSTGRRHRVTAKPSP